MNKLNEKMSVPVMIIIKGSIHLEDKAIKIVFIPNDTTSKDTKVKLTELQREIGKSIITVGISNT